MRPAGVRIGQSRSESILPGAPITRKGPFTGPSLVTGVSHQDRTSFDKLRQQFGRTRKANAGRSPEDRPKAIWVNPLGRDSSECHSRSVRDHPLRPVSRGQADWVRQNASAFCSERRSREPAGPKQPLGCFGQSYRARVQLDGSVALPMPTGVDKKYAQVVCDCQPSHLGARSWVWAWHRPLVRNRFAHSSGIGRRVLLTCLANPAHMWRRCCILRQLTGE